MVNGIDNVIYNGITILYSEKFTITKKVIMVKVMLDLAF